MRPPVILISVFLRTYVSFAIIKTVFWGNEQKVLLRPEMIFSEAVRESWQAAFSQDSLHYF
jgi:hypothetical protein